MAETILELLAGSPAPALGAPGRRGLDHRGLLRQVEDGMRAVRRLGVRRGDRVAMVLPNGPETAAAFLAVASAASAAPLNPAYRADELDFALGDLRARAVLVGRGGELAAEVARARGIPVVEVTAGEAAGRFTLSGDDGDGEPGPPPAPDDVALVLHTSGTTARPKQVPLTHANLCASARAVAAALRLGPADRALHLMPLFHIHGLVAGLLAPLAAGGSLFVPPGFDALRFAVWLGESAATWYTAVPTMHQAILARADRNRAIIARAGLRLVRSSSASLAPSVMQALEETFGAPVIEAYGMTEAAHQMTSNPLPPAARKPGTVGLPAGPEVSIRGGEVCVRGPGIMKGYDGDPAATAAAFVDGWFRTGDLGALDADGYLRLTGRLKEMINRGGEKIAPREVDEVLLAHPAVAQAVTFALPHDKLGEEVAAAVVLRGDAGEAELRDHVRAHLADFKVPKKIVFVDAIPTGPTGKLQRIGLARLLGLS
ncbi:MAG TPA: AMP-binding protein [Kofleriaceae bacterium]|nr:AMP-binding protein [Kofleriaceae bacterium]